MNPPQSSQKLIDFSKEHLCYEINQLFAGLELFAKSEKNEQQTLEAVFHTAAANLFLEGIIVHSRCLYNFLYGEPSNNPRNSDDALAIHYFDDPEFWKKNRPKESPLLSVLCSRAGKEVAHLTYHRARLNELTKTWDLYSITNDLLTILDLFTKHAERSKLHDDVSAIVEFWKSRTQHEPNQTQLNLITGSSGMTMAIATNTIKS